MYVDPRIAHARAKLQLSERAIDVNTLELSISRAITIGFASVAARKMTGRAMLRHLKGSVVPTLKRLGMNAFVFQDAEEILVIAYKLICDPSGLQGIAYTGRGSGVRSATWLSITPHAIARCLHRNGALSIGDINDELKFASSVAAAMVTLSSVAGCKQALVPTYRGLFLGSYDDDNGLVLRTYIKPGANGRPSRWDAVLEALPPVPHIGDWLELYMKTLSPWIDSNAASFTERFPFMGQAYVPTDDPHSAAWNAARSPNGAAN